MIVGVEAPKSGPTPAAARAIARAAYIFLYPLVVNYGVAYQMTIGAPGDEEGFGRWRRWRSVAPTPGRARAAVGQVSFTWLDVGPQAMLVWAPPNERGACAMQCLDLWGFTPEMSRFAPQGGAREAPLLVTAFADDTVAAGIDAEIRSETLLVSLSCTRDLAPDARPDPRVGDPVVMSLGEFRGVDSPSPPRANWFRWHDAVLTGPDFWDCAAFALSLAHPHPDDATILDRLRTIGVVAGVDRDPLAFDEAVTWAIDVGMHQAIEDLVRGARGVSAGGSRPTRRQIDRDYFGRAVLALAVPHPGCTRRGLGLVVDGH